MSIILMIERAKWFLFITSMKDKLFYESRDVSSREDIGEWAVVREAVGCVPPLNTHLWLKANATGILLILFQISCSLHVCMYKEMAIGQALLNRKPFPGITYESCGLISALLNSNKWKCQIVSIREHGRKFENLYVSDLASKATNQLTPQSYIIKSHMDILSPNIILLKKVTAVFAQQSVVCFLVLRLTLSKSDP